MRNSIKVITSSLAAAALLLGFMAPGVSASESANPTDGIAIVEDQGEVVDVGADEVPPATSEVEGEEFEDRAPPAIAAAVWAHAPAS